MSVNHQILIAGFGGQGILFSGKYLVYTGMLADHEVTWLPSYGPEMRGGTANCSVIISDTLIGSPIVSKPNILIVMNLPSYDKYEGSAAPGGKIFVDSSLITRAAGRTDVDSFFIPATQLAMDNNLKGLANMIMIGKVIRETQLCPYDHIKNTMLKVVPASKKELLELNLKAVDIGYNY